MNLKELAFERDDFYPHYGDETRSIALAEFVNALLEQKLSKALRVYGYKYKYGSTWNEEKTMTDNLSGRVVAIEELK